MSNDSWLSSAEAAQVLKMSARQVHRYGVSGRLKTRRTGRRLLYRAADVAALADELNVDEKPLPLASPADTRIIDYLRQRDEQIIGIDERTRRIEEALHRLEAQRRGPSWTQVLTAAIILATVLVVLVVIVLAVS